MSFIKIFSLEMVVDRCRPGPLLGQIIAHGYCTFLLRVPARGQTKMWPLAASRFSEGRTFSLLTLAEPLVPQVQLLAPSPARRG